MAKYRITYETFIEVEASDEVEARELSYEMNDELLVNLQEMCIEKI